MRTRSEVARRYDFERSGGRMIFGLMALLIALAVIYVLAHQIRKPISTVAEPKTLVEMDAWGRASIKSADDIEWNVGKEKAVPLLTLMEQRSQRIQAVVNKLQDSLVELREQFGPMRQGGVSHITDAVRAGNFTNALTSVTALRHELSPSTLGVQGSVLVARLETLLSDLTELKLEQQQARENLRTPDRYVVFWMTPRLVLVEVVWWSLFGLLTSLLFDLSWFQERKKYEPARRWVIYAKLVYTPFIGLALVLGLWAGLIKMGGPESRVWLMPLLSFLIGFNVFKAANVVDALSDWVLKRAAAGLGRPDADGEAEREARLKPYMQAMPSAYLSDFRAEAKAKARELILRELMDREQKA